MRYAPGRGLPPYAFLPGRDPHPTRDPAGHSYGRAEPPSSFWPSARWRENGEYLYGADLYNHGFLWEAHEAWEGQWHAAKRDPTQALYLQALIQCAAAWLKIPMGQPRGLERLASMALEKLVAVRSAGAPAYMGLTLDPFCAAVRAFAESQPTALAGYPLLHLEDGSR